VLSTKNKTKTTAIAIFLVLTITATLVALPLVSAHDPGWNIPTYAYVTCSPSTVGVSDYTLIVMWVDKYPPTAGGSGGDRWHGFTLDITKPDGTKETIPYTGETSQVGSAFTTYTPDQVGDYTIVFSWPGQTLTNGTGVPDNVGVPYVGDYYEGSTSEPFILHVQQEPIQEWTEPPLPIGYWTRPINAANRYWSTLASNWLGGSQFRYNRLQESGQAPNSPHIVWQEPITAAYPGGIVDATWPGQPVDVNDYESPWSDPIIINGKVYYNTPNTAETATYGYYCVDLYTGQQIWYKNGTDNGLNNPISYTSYQGPGGTGNFPSSQSFPRLSFGQLYHYDSVNGQGILGYLWMTVGSTWYMLDAATGNVILTLINVPGGSAVTDQDGSLLRYSYNARTGQFLCWNTSQSIAPLSPTGTGQQQWKPRMGAVIDAVNDTYWTSLGPSPNDPRTPWYEDDILPRSGYTMNVTGPTGLPPLSNVLRDENGVPRIMFFQNMRNDLYSRGDEGSSSLFFQAAAVSIDEHVAPNSPFPDKTNTQNNNLGYGVTLLWNKTITRPLGGNLTWQMGPISYEDKVFTVWAKETMQWWGYSLDDGSLLWGPTTPQGDWDMYGSGGFYAYGKLFSGGYGGVLYAYDIKTGKLLWNYTLTQIGHESPYGNFQITLSGVADGKVYIHSTEHSPTKPLWRGSYFRCINATDGTEIWKILDYSMGSGIADGYIVTASQYDNMVYCIGKGPSSTTVTASPDISVHGTSVLITGTVTDQSPGAKKIAPNFGYVNGVPVVSDADQQVWMEYLYMQQACPTTATGVEVTLDTLDPNGNFIHIGTVTSDMSGGFKKMFTPEVPGEYTIIATFAGSESYGSSYAQTYMGVSEAPPATAAPEYPQPIDNTWTIVGVGIAIILVVVIVGILLLRKK
jgi:outer membrane protein assembly factor BamB